MTEQTVITMEIIGDPKAQKRHKHAKIGNFIKVYDPSEVDKRNYLLTLQHNAPEKPLSGPLEVVLTFHLGRPKNHYGSGKNSEMLKDSAPEWHSSKPDCDNLAKFVLDSLNGVFYTDDAKISCLGTRKLYSDRPRTEIIIKTL